MSQSGYNWWPTGQLQAATSLGQAPASAIPAQSQLAGAASPPGAGPQTSMGRSSGAETPAGSQPSVVVPAIDVYETADEIVILADTPGFDEDTIELQADEQSLLITASREQESEEGRTPLLQERPTHLERIVQVPPGADIEGAKATHEDGVCTVTIPKTESRRRRTIAFQ